MMSERTLWWGYLPANGEPQVKRWFGDVADYTTDCYGNDFVQRVVPPFEATTHAEAEAKLREALGLS